MQIHKQIAMDSVREREREEKGERERGGERGGCKRVMGTRVTEIGGYTTR